MQMTGTYFVKVEIATSRPPRSHESLFYAIHADTGEDAERAAVEWAMQNPLCVMPVAIVVLDWPE